MDIEDYGFLYCGGGPNVDKVRADFGSLSNQLLLNVYIFGMRSFIS